MINIDKKMTLEELEVKLGLNGTLVVDGDKMSLVAIEDSMMCPECKKDDTITELQEGEDEEHNLGYLECPRCGYYALQDPRSEIDDDDDNYYI